MKNLSLKSRKKNPRTSPLKPKPGKRQSVSLHLQELRSRFMWCMISLLLSSALGYFIHQQILSVLIRPLNQPIFYVSPAGGLDFIIKICLFFGLLVSLPVFMYQVFRYVAPALPKTSNTFIVSVLVLSMLLMIAGVLFAYFFSLPSALLFLGRFGTDNIKSLISTDAYLSFMMRYLLGFGLLFQLPLVLFIINSFKPLSFKMLMRYQRWLFLISFIAAAIITPTPDVFNMSFMALPIIVLYQISIIAIVIKNKGKHRSNMLLNLV